MPDTIGRLACDTCEATMAHENRDLMPEMLPILEKINQDIDLSQKDLVALSEFLHCLQHHQPEVIVRPSDCGCGG